MKMYDIGAELTLQKAVDILSMRELTKTELAHSKAATVEAVDAQSVDAVNSRRLSRGNAPSRQNPEAAASFQHGRPPDRSSSTRNCGYCNRIHPPGKRNCPAAHTHCRKCNKLGHFANVCRSSVAVREVQQEDYIGNSNHLFVGGVHNKETPHTYAGWYMKLKTGSHELIWFIDTGAQVSVMPDHAYRPYFGSLHHPDRRLIGPGDQPLDVTGFAYIKLTSGKTSIWEKIYIVRSSRLLLGQPAIDKLGLIHDIPGAFTIRAIRTTPDDKPSPKELPLPTCADFSSKADIQAKYPHLFQGLGELEGEQHVTLKDDAQPFCQTVPRRVPIPLLKKVEAQLNKMVDIDVIERVDTPTDWCAPIVVVPKSSGDVRLCIDLTKLNKHVKREIYAMPSIEETLSKIAQGNIFSKLDANSGFHQIKLDEESSQLTTFITPYGRYRFKRLPYGISSAPEYFQKKMDHILYGLEGVLCHMDDILIFGKNKVEHDARLKLVLDRLSASGLTLNVDKFEFAKTQLEYFGQVINADGVQKDPAKQRYAQIEKEALAITWSLEHWADLLIGMTFRVHTDHKPLVPLFSTKLIDELPIRIQRFRMRLMRFCFDITHVPGKELYTADALSRALLELTKSPVDNLIFEADAYVGAIMLTLPASDRRLEEIRSELKKDDTLRVVLHHVQNGWPDKKTMNNPIKAYANEQGNLSVHEGLLLRGSRLVIPSSLRQDVLSKTKENAANSVWWPGLSYDIEMMVKICPDCAKCRQARVEPMKGTPFPERPWSRVAADFLHYNGKLFLLTIDYYSRDVELVLVSHKVTAVETIARMKKVFSRHGIPDTLMTDNGPQFSAEEFATFAQSWGFEHITSSPHYPQANGEVERAVQTIKNLIKKSDDEYLGLLMYRNTPLPNGFSPAQLSMGRRLKTRVPCHPDSLLPHTPDPISVKKKEKEYREKMKVHYDRRHEVVAPEQLSPGDAVWIPDQKKEGWIIENHEAPRSVVIETSDGGMLRRNRQMTRKLHQPAPRPEPAGSPHMLHAPPEQDEVLSPTQDPSPSTLFCVPPEERKDASLTSRAGVPVGLANPSTLCPSHSPPAVPETFQSTLRRSSKARIMPKKFQDYVVNT
ncbi:hypothetical protein ACOMHN_038408 [Nucella lapillus]